MTKEFKTRNPFLIALFCTLISHTSNAMLSSLIEKKALVDGSDQKSRTLLCMAIL